MLIQCEECTAQVEAAQAQAIRPSGPGLVEHGLMCPVCRNWTHAYFMTPALVELRQRLEAFKRAVDVERTPRAFTRYTTARSAYTRHFEATQARFKRKRGIR